MVFIFYIIIVDSALQIRISVQICLIMFLALEI
jgi:hypothetical protein